MQPKFTQRNLWSFYPKTLALAIVLFVLGQVSFAQQAPAANHKAAMIERMNSPLSLDNDAGLPRRVANPTPNRGQSVCQTYTGSLAAGDATMPQRMFRPGGTTPVCTVPYTFPGIIALNVFYDTYTYTNNTGSTQCGTFNLTTTDLTNANIQFGIWNGSFNPTNMATNYMADPWVSTGTPAAAAGLSFQATINAGQTIVIVVWSANSSGGATGTASNYTVKIDFPLCAPCVAITSVTAPATVTGQCSSTVNIPATVSPAGASIATYAWEYRTSPSSVWLNALNGGLGGVISNATTSTLTLAGVTPAMNGYQFRAVVTPPGSCGFGVDFSNPSTLTVTQLQTAVTPTSATICKGSIIPISITNPSSPTTVTFNASSGLPLFIPDANLTGVNNTIVTSGLPTSSYVISDITVTVSIPAHTWVGDLNFVLKAPNGQILNLDYFMSNTGRSGTGIVNTKISSNGVAALNTGTPPFTATFKADAVTSNIGFGQAGPNGFLPTTNSWNNLTSQLNGNWTLALYDGFSGDTGSLTAWSITITYGAPSAGTWTASPSTPNTMWLDAAGTIPYPGPPATANTIYVNPQVNTNYTVTYSTGSCPGLPVTVPVTVITPLTNQVNPTNQTVCVGGTTSFTASATGGPFNYQWQESRDNGLTWQNINNGGVYSGATTGTLTLTGVTRSAASDMNLYRYRVVMNAAPCAGSFTSASALLTVNALPTVTLTADDLALTPGQVSHLTVTSSPAANATPNYVWTLNGNTVAGATSNTYTADINHLGVYRASVTDVNGCRNTSNSVLIESEVSNQLWIYPNPTTGKFQVRWYYNGVYTEKRRVTIYNAAGQNIKSADFPMSNVSPHYQQMDFDLTGLSGGVYVIDVYDLYDRQHVQGLLIKQ